MTIDTTAMVFVVCVCAWHYGVFVIGLEYRHLCLFWHRLQRCISVIFLLRISSLSLLCVCMQCRRMNEPKCCKNNITHFVTTWPLYLWGGTYSSLILCLILLFSCILPSVQRQNTSNRHWMLYCRYWTIKVGCFKQIFKMQIPIQCSIDSGSVEEWATE